jgi:hypothetical protein
MMFSSKKEKKKEGCSPNMYEELQAYFARWRVKTALAVH